MSDTFELMTPEEFLEHHGVKGMRWGHRKAQDSGSSGGGSAKPAKPKKPTTEDIHNARIRNASRKHEINNQIVRTNLASGKAQIHEAQKLAKMQASFLKSPDRATALRMTKGEKFLFTGLGIATAGTGVGLGVAVGAGVRVAARKSIEKKQRQQAMRVAKKSN